jgi:hypothetical protein
MLLHANEQPETTLLVLVGFLAVMIDAVLYCVGDRGFQLVGVEVAPIRLEWVAGLRR